MNGHDGRHTALPADPALLVSDDEREQVVAALRRATAEGRLTLDEFEERAAAAYAARTGADLQATMRQLPPPAEPPPPDTRRSHARDALQRAPLVGLAVAMAVLALFALGDVGDGPDGDGFFFPWPLLFWGFFISRHRHWHRHRHHR